MNTVRKGHAAKLGNSDRLQKLMAVLKDRQWHTGLELSLAVKTTAIAAAVNELRDEVNRFIIDRKQEGNVHYYRLTGRTPRAPVPAPEQKEAFEEKRKRWEERWPPPKPDPQKGLFK